MKALRPNYFGEFLYVRPFDPALLVRLESVLSDPRTFVGIPYYSRRNDTVYDLFDKVELLAPAREEGRTKVIAVLQHMEPFDDYRATYRLWRGDREISFDFANEDALVYSYRNLRAAGPGDMGWTLVAFESKGWLWFYGAGGVKAFDLFGAFRDRLEASFMGRIESFFTFVLGAVRD